MRVIIWHFPNLLASERQLLEPDKRGFASGTAGNTKIARIESGKKYPVSKQALNRARTMQNLREESQK